MAFVREKKVRGKGGTIHRYYALVEGRRVDGKVKQRQLAHLGKHDSIEEARAYAASLSSSEAKPATGDLETVLGLYREYWRHHEEYRARKSELDGIKKTVNHLNANDARSKAAKDERKQLNARRAQIQSHLDHAEDAGRRAVEVFDALPREQQEEVQQNRLVWEWLKDMRGRPR